MLTFWQHDVFHRQFVHAYHTIGLRETLYTLHFMQGVILAFPSHPEEHFTTFELTGLGNECFVGPIMIFEEW